MEQLLADVKPGDTPATSEALARLELALQPYL